MTSSEQPSSGSHQGSPSGHGQSGSGASSGSGSAPGGLTIEWGGKTVGQAPTHITKGKPVTVTYDRSVSRATITIDDDKHETKPFTQAVKFPENVAQGDIQVKAHQDEQNPRKVTLTLVKGPESKPGGGQDGGGSNGPTGSEGGTQGTGNTTEDRTGPQHHGGTGTSGQQDGSGAGAGALHIDWGGQVDANAPKTLTKGKPATATYGNSVTKATVTVDDDDPKTEAWTQQFKFGDAQQEEIHVELKQDPSDPRKVTVKAVQWPAKATKLTVHWGGKTTDGGESGGEGKQPTGGDKTSGAQQPSSGQSQSGQEKQQS